MEGNSVRQSKDIQTQLCIAGAVAIVVDLVGTVEKQTTHTDCETDAKVMNSIKIIK